MTKSFNNIQQDSVTLLGIKIDSLALDQLLSETEFAIKNNHRIIISNANLHAANIAYGLPWFREFLNTSHLTFCDGVGLKLAAMFTGQQLSYRFTPPDFIDSLCERAVRFGWRLYFLGAKPGVAQRAANLLGQKFPSLQVETHHGYFDKSVNSQENKLVIDHINRCRPQILILGFGMPLQERWILENFSSLELNIALPAGALFDYLSKTVPRAPRWMTDNGLEWIGRLVIEPRRLWKRYLLGNPVFFWRLFIHHYLGIPLPY